MQVKNVNSLQKTKRIKRIRGKGIPVKQSIWMKSIQMKSIQRKCRQMKKNILIKSMQIKCIPMNSIQI